MTNSVPVDASGADSQTYPTFSSLEIDKLARFGEQRSYSVGQRLWEPNEPDPHLLIVISGQVSIVRRPVQHLFLFIGADPNTSWLADSGVALGDKGFIKTGVEADSLRTSLETNIAGVYAIGDVRSGSTKRVAAAVGEGAQVVAAIHARLALAMPKDLKSSSTH